MSARSDGSIIPLAPALENSLLGLPHAGVQGPYAAQSKQKRGEASYLPFPLVSLVSWCLEEAFQWVAVDPFIQSLVQCFYGMLPFPLVSIIAIVLLKALTRQLDHARGA